MHSLNRSDCENSFKRVFHSRHFGRTRVSEGRIHLALCLLLQHHEVGGSDSVLDESLPVTGNRISRLQPLDFTTGPVSFRVSHEMPFEAARLDFDQARSFAAAGS